MKKRHFQNCLSIEKRTFESNVKKYKSFFINKDVKSETIIKKVQSVYELSDSVPGCSQSANVGLDREDSEIDYAEVVSIDSEPGFSSEFITKNSSSEENMDASEKCEVIKSWAVRNKVSQSSLEDLLRSLRRIGVVDLPLSAKTLLNTSKENIHISKIPDGEFLYLGIQKYFLSSSFEFLDGKDEVSIDVGVDGLKLFKSSNRVLWPILGKIVGFDSIKRSC